MKKFLLLAMLTPIFSYGQWHVNLFGGFSNYIGDLQKKAYTTQQGHLAFGLGAQYDLTSHISLVGNFNYAHVSAYDGYATRPDVRARNLSFETKIAEANLLLQYNILDLDVHHFTPYVFAGVAVYHFNPYTYDTLGHKVDLRPLSTEGQGLAQYPDRKPYHLTQFAVPFGGGIKVRVTDRVTLAYEIGLRKLFTDYLDDVSTRYVDRATLFAAKGSQAVEMAYRGNEIKGAPPYPTSGTVRGGSKYKDWYYLSGIRVTIALNSNRTEQHRRSNGVIDCPKKVY